MRSIRQKSKPHISSNVFSFLRPSKNYVLKNYNYYRRVVHVFLSRNTRTSTELFDDHKNEKLIVTICDMNLCYTLDTECLLCIYCNRERK